MTVYIVKTHTKQLLCVVAETSIEACAIARRHNYNPCTVWVKEFTYYAMPSMLKRVDAGDYTEIM